MKKLCAILIITLLLSIAINILLAMKLEQYHKALVDQGLNTLYIEQILKETGGDISFKTIENIMKNKYPKSYAVIDTSNYKGAYDKNGLKLFDTIFLFYEDKYVGSRLAVPNDY